MKKSQFSLPFRILCSVALSVSFAMPVFFFALYYLGWINFYCYFPTEVVVETVVWVLVTVSLSAIPVAIIFFLLRSGGKLWLQNLCVLLAILLTPGLIYLGLISMVVAVLGPNGYSYTEDIANYGVYDKEFGYSHFPEAISEDMEVVDFCYYFKYVDARQIDLYLEVQFENEETMEMYLAEAIASFSQTQTFSNPYDPSYTDVIADEWALLSPEGNFAAYIEFDSGSSVDYKYVEAGYAAVSYSYEDLTIIYTGIYVGSDLEITDHYPRYLERFGVEWDPKNDFSVTYEKQES